MRYHGQGHEIEIPLPDRALGPRHVTEASSPRDSSMTPWSSNVSHSHAVISSPTTTASGSGAAIAHMPSVRTLMKSCSRGPQLVLCYNY